MNKVVAVLTALALAALLGSGMFDTYRAQEPGHSGDPGAGGDGLGGPSSAERDKIPGDPSDGGWNPGGKGDPDDGVF